MPISKNILYEYDCSTSAWTDVSKIRLGNFKLYKFLEVWPLD